MNTTLNGYEHACPTTDPQGKIVHGIDSVEHMNKDCNCCGNKDGLTCLRVSMPCHRFTNPREILQGNASRKLTSGMASEACNCRTERTKGCEGNNICGNKTEVKRVDCKNTGKIHIGNTGRNFKKRMQEHFKETKDPH